MNIVEMWEALPDGSKEDYEKNLTGHTKYRVALDIMYYRQREGRNKNRVRHLVEAAYKEHVRQELIKNKVIREPVFMPWESGTEEKVISIADNPHEFGTQLDQILARRK